MTDMKSDVVDHFKATLRGPLLQPGDPDYDGARSIWNAMIGRTADAAAQARVLH